jgi:hypothetical protein
VLPEKINVDGVMKNKTVKTFDDKGECMEQPINEVFQGEKYTYASLKLMKQEDGSLKEIGDEIPLRGSKKVNIEFSPDGKFFAILFKKINLLQVWEVVDNDIEGLFE